MKVYVGEVTIKIPFASVVKDYPEKIHRHYIELVGRDEISRGETGETAIRIMVDSKEFDL